jgi:hypothetical protein
MLVYKMQRHWEICIVVQLLFVRKIPKSAGSITGNHMTRGPTVSLRREEQQGEMKRKHGWVNARSGSRKYPPNHG